MKQTKITIKCQKCGFYLNAYLFPGCDAHTYGTPEQCYPEEPDEVDPDKCPECGMSIDLDESIQLAADECERDKEAAVEARRERMSEEE